MYDTARLHSRSLHITSSIDLMTPYTTAEEHAKDILSKLLHSLDCEFEIDTISSEDGSCLMIASPQASYLIGENGERLDDLQYLVNRSMQCSVPDAARIRIDCEGYRQRSEEKLLHRARSRAESVLATGNPLRMEALNAYQRRLVHTALAQIEGIQTHSEDVDSRFKRITISRKY